MAEKTIKTTAQTSLLEAELDKYKANLTEANEKIARLEDVLAQSIAVRSEPIKARTIIAVEGKDEVDFFKV
jgi:5-bromo-4-chloroindolyl phosphate hydrolysis protein